MADRVIKLEGRGLRGESFADIGRRVGEVGGYPVPPNATDQEVLDALTTGAVEAVAPLVEAAEIAAAAVGTYPDTATGLAATTDGQSFYVASGGEVKLYLNDGGTAVEQAGLATSSAIEAVETEIGNVSTGLDSLADEVGNIQTEVGEQVGGFDIAPSGKVSPLGGVVRQPSAGAGWDFIVDSGHEPLNMSGSLVVNASGNLEVPYATTYGKVGVVPVTLDETFAGLGIFAGGSVGNNKLTISAYKTLDASVNLQTANVVPSTYFAGRVTAANNGDGTITITHPSVGTSSLVPQITSLAGPYNHKIISYTATTIVIGVFTRLKFRVWYNGTAWQVATPAKVKPTVTSFGAGGLVIAYNQTIPTAYTLPLIGCMKDGNTIAKVGIGSSATTQIVLGFRDFSGAAVTTPSTEMDVTIELPIDVLAETPLGAASISRQNCKLNLGDVYSPDGNFWIGPGLNVR